MNINSTVTGIDNNDELAKGLYSYIYHNLHSRPYSEYRHNLKLFPLFQTTKTNIFNYKSTSIRLPASGRWFLYSVENTDIVAINLPHDNTAWTCFGDYIDNKSKESVTGYCSATGVDMRFTITAIGKCIPRHQIWVLRNPKANNFIIAINEAAIDKLTNTISSIPPTISLNVYYHKKDEYFKVVGYNCVKLTERNKFYDDCSATSEYQRIIFINGVEVIPKTLADIPVGSYGEIVYDSSIVGVFTIDFNATADPVYYESDNTARILCHIPKSFNSNNHLLNHRVCDIFIHPDSTSVRSYTDGLYIDRTNTDAMFTTITHNDFAINRALVLNYCSLFGESATGLIKIYVRDHNKGLTLEKDPNFIWSLYQLDDDTIVKHLLGQLSMPIWKATNIAASTWAKMMDQYLEGVTYTDFESCVQTLGYINSANAICSRVQHILVSNELVREFYIPIPICYNENDKLTCHIFVDGLLVDNDLTKFKKNKQFLVIILGNNIPLVKGSRITVEIFEDAPYRAKEITLNSGESYTFITDSKYEIYKRYDFDDTNYIADDFIFNRFKKTSVDVSGKGITADTSYRELLDIEYDAYTRVQHNDETGYDEVTVTNVNSASLTMLVVSKYAYSKLYGVERHLKEFNYDICCSHMLKIQATEYDERKYILTTDSTVLADKQYYMKVDNMWFPAYKQTTDTTFQTGKVYYTLDYTSLTIVQATVVVGKTIPTGIYFEAIGVGDIIVPNKFYESSYVTGTNRIYIPYLNTDRTLLVYMNGKELIEGLDYKDYSIYTNRHNTCGQFIIFQNVDYLKLTSNVLEVFTVNERLVALDQGFLTEAKTESVMSHMAFYKNIGQVFVDGTAMQYSDDKNYIVDINAEIRKGASYKIRALVPYCLTSKLDDVATVDSTNIANVTNYLESVLSTPIQITPITRSYHIYSTFLQTVTEQILRNKLKYDINWSDERIKSSLAPYTSMLKYDIGLASENDIRTDPDKFIKPYTSGIDFRFVDVLPSYRLERVEDSDLTITEKRPLIIVDNSNIDGINGNYICMNPGIEYMKDYEAKHINNNAYKHWENANGCFIEHSDNYWILYSKDKTAHYRAYDNLGIVEIWNLNWIAINSETPINLNTVFVEVNTVNEFPFHRLQNTFSIDQYAYLMRVARMYLPNDLTKDGMNI